MKIYEQYLSLRFNYRAFGTPPVPLIGSHTENLVMANLVMQGVLYSEIRFLLEMEKKTGRDWKEAA